MKRMKAILFCLLGYAHAFHFPSPKIRSHNSVSTSSTRSWNPLRLENEQSGSMMMTSPPPPTKTLLQRIDDAGMALKPKALEARQKSNALQLKTSKKVLYTCQSCALLALFIVYRAYRGCFVLLPAVFRRVYDTLEKTVENPFSSSPDENTTNVGGIDVNPKTGKTRLRTVVTVSVLAGIVTLSYTITGAIRVITCFLNTVSRTSSPSLSFLAAANEMESNEVKINDFSTRTGMKKINGENNLDGMAP